MHALVVELLAQPGLVDRLAAVHVPDGHGRCRGCPTGGTGTPAARWPCRIADLAAAGQRAVTGPKS